MADVVVMFSKRADVPIVIEQRHIDKIKECASGNVYWCGSEQEALEKGIDGEVLFFWGGSGEMPVEYCRKSKKLKWLNSFSAGVNPVMESPIAAMDVKLTNAKGIHGITMGLSTLGYIICFLRKLPVIMRNQTKHIWNKTFETMPEDAEGKTVVVLGAGAIGSEVARYCKGVGMKTIGVKRSVTPLDFFDEVMPDTALKEAAALGDFVVVVTPLTDATRNMVNMDVLKCMKPTSVLINIGRGPVVNTDDLVEALKTGVIAGAALDAVDPEPLPVDHPLWDMENVIVSPHCSADSTKYIDRAMDLFCRNIERFEAGEPLINEISMADKY